MTRILTCTLMLAFSIPVTAASEAGRFSKTVETAPQFLYFLRSETQKWTDAGKGGAIKIPHDQIGYATDLIRVCRILTIPHAGELAATFEKALQEETAKTVGAAYTLFGGQAYFDCLKLGTALSTQAKESKSQAKQELIKYLKAAHFPSYMIAIRKLKLIESGLESKIWKFNESQKTAFEKFKTELTKTREAHMAKFDTLPSEEDEPKKDDPKSLQIFKDEMLNARSYMARIQEFAAQLK